MSELGPTRTYSDIGGTDSGHVRNVSARKRLRELLDDELGVKWIEENPGVTYWSDGTHAFIAEEYGDGKLEVKTLMTPEQAVAATLGADDTYTREDCEASFVHGYSLGSLPVGSDPRWDENRQTVDEHMAELGWVRKDATSLTNDELSDRDTDAHVLSNAYAAAERHIKEVEAENAKLRELVKGLQYCAYEACGMCARMPIGGGRPFTCCPLYDFDAREYRCEKLMRELGIEVEK